MSQVQVKPGDTLYALMSGDTIVYGGTDKNGLDRDALCFFVKGQKFGVVELKVVTTEEKTL